MSDAATDSERPEPQAGAAPAQAKPRLDPELARRNRRTGVRVALLALTSLALFAARKFGLYG